MATLYVDASFPLSLVICVIASVFELETFRYLTLNPGVVVENVERFQQDKRNRRCLPKQQAYQQGQTLSPLCGLNKTTPFSNSEHNRPSS